MSSDYDYMDYFKADKKGKYGNIINKDNFSPKDLKNAVNFIITEFFGLLVFDELSVRFFPYEEDGVFYVSIDSEYDISLNPETLDEMNEINLVRLEKDLDAIFPDFFDVDGNVYVNLKKYGNETAELRLGFKVKYE